MKISVLIAAYRAGPTITAALASVRSQTHAEWELIVVEDGPRDDTEPIIRDFVAVARRPVVYENMGETQGLASARNRLLELATGDAVAFLEPEDSWTPRHLANAVPQLSSGFDISVSDVRVFDPTTDRPISDSSPPPQLVTNPVRALFSRDVFVTNSCVVARRDAVTTAGRFDPRFQVGEGRDFWLRCALTGARFCETHRATCRSPRRAANSARTLASADSAVQFYEKHRELAAVPAALRRRLLAASLVTQGRLLRATDPARAARCFWRAWSLQPVHVQTLGQFALTGWRVTTPTPKSDPET
jgi:glycosyltransferase involved in cell wall biosynthesis